MTGPKVRLPSFAPLALDGGAVRAPAPIAPRRPQARTLARHRRRLIVLALAAAGAAIYAFWAGYLLTGGPR